MLRSFASYVCMDDISSYNEDLQFLEVSPYERIKQAGSHGVVRVAGWVLSALYVAVSIENPDMQPLALGAFAVLGVEKALLSQARTQLYASVKEVLQPTVDRLNRIGDRMQEITDVFDEGHATIRASNDRLEAFLQGQSLNPE